jgi:hypothetical protein
MERQPQTEDRPTEPIEPIDEESYGGSASESGGLYNEDGPTAANVSGDTMGTRDEAPPGEEPESDPESG